MNILPIFTSHYTFGDSILTLEEAGKTTPGNPVSICDLAKQNNLKEVILVEDRIDGFIEAYKSIQKSGLAQLIYGLRFTVVSDMKDKNQETRRNESRVIVFFKNTQGYNDAIRLWNRAWTEGFFTPARDAGYGRLDWKTLKEFWTPNLSIALPFFSSFIAKNALTFASIVPEFPVKWDEIWAFREMNSQIPFAPLLEKALDDFNSSINNQLNIQPIKSVYYASPNDFEAYVTFRAIHERSEFSRPNVNNLASNSFSFEAWKELCNVK